MGDFFSIALRDDDSWAKDIRYVKWDRSTIDKNGDLGAWIEGTASEFLSDILYPDSQAIPNCDILLIAARRYMVTFVRQVPREECGDPLDTVFELYSFSWHSKVSFPH